MASYEEILSQFSQGCLGCGRTTKTKSWQTCSACSVARYCTKRCRERHQDIHNTQCNKYSRGYLYGRGSFDFYQVNGCFWVEPKPRRVFEVLNPDNTITMTNDIREASIGEYIYAPHSDDMTRCVIAHLNDAAVQRTGHRLGKALDLKLVDFDELPDTLSQALQTCKASGGYIVFGCRRVKGRHEWETVHPDAVRSPRHVITITDAREMDAILKATLDATPLPGECEPAPPSVKAKKRKRKQQKTHETQRESECDSDGMESVQRTVIG
jgi:hypothetical protein